MQSMITKHNIEFAEEEDAHKILLTSQDLLTGNLARINHDREIQNRLTYDPQYANTPREKTILDIVKISNEKTLSTSQVLHDIAVLASPKEAEVSVSRVNDGYIVDVSFNIAVMTSGEEGARTKHSSKTTLKREVIEIISRVIKDLYDNCGYQGIYKIRVACEHGVRMVKNEYDTGFIEMTVIYKCSISKNDAMKVSNWRTIPIYRVSEMLNVEHDEFPDLFIKTTSESILNW